MTAIVVARDLNGAIGRSGDMPWGRQLKADLMRFKEITTGGTIILGHTTYLSIGRPLPNRLNIVLSRQSLRIPGVVVLNSLSAALGLSGDGDDVFVIGGAQVYTEALPFITTIFETVVDGTFAEIDTWFPAIDRDAWELAESSYHGADEDNIYAMHFNKLLRKGG
jgi:dihydrofolate reductase